MKVKVSAKALASAVAFAVESALAVAFVKELRNALADADAENAVAFAELRKRICTLEMHQGIRWSVRDECYYPATVEDRREWPTLPETGQGRTTIRESGRVESTTLD